MHETLSESEIKRINELISESPSSYLSDWSIRPSNDSVKTLEEQLRADMGDSIAEKAIQTPHVKMLGVRGLYDGLYQVLINVPPESIRVGVFHPEVERGQIDYIKFGKHVVLVKSYQGNQERDIAKLASDMQRGPKVYGPGVELVEDFLGERELPHHHPFEVGRMAGELLRDLHSANVIYGDSFAWHFRHDKRDKRLKLIDFGVSFLYDGSEAVDKDYVWRVIGMVDGPMSFSELGKIKSNPQQVKRYSTIPPDELKAKELEVMMDEVASSFRFPIQYGGFRLFSKGRFQKNLEQGILEGYNSNPQTSTTS
jgi:hypothetical protein|tara:strand:+ start:363 stop:1295 length:933 start_codon:yes stop_codon:yes gene_type:complete